MASVLSRSQESGTGKPVPPNAGRLRLSYGRICLRGIDANRREFTFSTANRCQVEHIIVSRERLKPGSYR